MGQKKAIEKRQTVKGIIFTIYFAVKSLPLSCKVIADDAEQAIEKVKEAFPGRRIAGLYSEHSYFKDPMQQRDILVL